MSTAEKILTVTVMRELYSRCFYCAASIAHTPLAQLAKVDGRNRLAHIACPEDTADAQ